MINRGKKIVVFCSATAAQPPGVLQNIYLINEILQRDIKALDINFINNNIFANSIFDEEDKIEILTQLKSSMNSSEIIYELLMDQNMQYTLLIRLIVQSEDYRLTE